MDDTSPDVKVLYRSLLMQRSGEERLKMGCGMFDSARALVKASLTAHTPEDLKMQLFLRTYGSDFDAETKARIVMALTTPEVLGRVQD
ncbi:MAG: hypothetical protein R3F37_07845 [Candidatus Competibacteraceae bacterium]